MTVNPPDGWLLRHPCLDCRKELAADPVANVARQPRKIATADGDPKRCVSHQQAFIRNQRKQARARSIERTYDISAEDAHELFLFQGGKCWLCRKATGATKSLAVDHDHATGEVRGRLCGPCNQFIGRLDDDPAAAQRLMTYLTGDTPYRRLKARQTLMSEGRSGGQLIDVHQVYFFGDELYAAWTYQGPVEGVVYSTLVRLANGTWTTERPTLVTDSEPRVETPGESGSCHALPDQPHTEYCETLVTG